MSKGSKQRRRIKRDLAFEQATLPATTRDVVATIRRMVKDKMKGKE